MLDKDTTGGKFMIAHFISFCKRVFLCRFFRNVSTRMEFLQSLIPRVCQQHRFWINVRCALFEETEVVCPAGAESCCDNFVFITDNELCLQGVSLLFSRIVLFLLVFTPLFFGRSIGLSATSMIVYLPSFFSRSVCLPLRWNL